MFLAGIIFTLVVGGIVWAVWKLFQKLEQNIEELHWIRQTQQTIQAEQARLKQRLGEVTDAPKAT